LAQIDQFEAERFDLPEHAEHSRAPASKPVSGSARA
jgi:hypothetical protein